MLVSFNLVFLKSLAGNRKAKQLRNEIDYLLHFACETLPTKLEHFFKPIAPDLPWNDRDQRWPPLVQLFYARERRDIKSSLTRILFVPWFLFQFSLRTPMSNGWRPMCNEGQREEEQRSPVIVRKPLNRILQRMIRTWICLSKPMPPSLLRSAFTIVPTNSRIICLLSRHRL